MKKLLLKVAKAERIHKADELAAGAASNSNGDIRHAINSLQFHCTASTKGHGDDGCCGHDKFLANLHSIGKLLRAKRECADVLRKRIVNFSEARWPPQWYRACGGRRRHGLE